MYNLNEDIFIDSITSKTVLNSIIKKEKISFKKLKIDKIKKHINNLKKEYLELEKENKITSLKYKNYIFWELVKKKYSQNIIKITNRNQKKFEKVNIVFADIGTSVGYNPSLLSLLIYSKEIKNLLYYNDFFKELQKNGELENISIKKKISIINKIKRGKLKLVTPLCPDYEHVKIAFGLYKYTFNKLNEDLGLIGKRLIKIIDKIHKIFVKYNISFNHELYYGDFEAFSKDILDRTKETEESFMNKVKKSSKKMNKVINKNTRSFLFVKKFTNKLKFNELCRKNEIRIINKMKTDINLRKNISEITASRSALYSSWFPEYSEKDYEKLLIKQGAEYLTMGQIFNSKFKNFFILGLDHPKMGFFYNLFDEIISIYGKPKYA